MSLPYRQQWQLRQIDHALHRSDLHLAAMLAIFTRLTTGEELQAVERLRVPAWRLLARMLGGVVLFGICAARGMGRAARRMVAGVGWLLRVPLLRSARPGPGTTAPELRRNS
jgi:hypothetical protein